jgi:PAP2 superfamily
VGAKGRAREEVSVERIQVQEWAMGALGLGVTIALVARAGWCGETVSALAITAAYAMIVWRTDPASRLRLLASYGMVWAGYAGSSPVIEALRLPLQSEALLAADRRLLGETPSIFLSTFRQTWVGESLSLGYLSYQIYLHWALIEAFWKSGEWRVRLSRMVFTAFAVGLAGYYLFPGASPYLAHADFYDRPVAGGWLTRFNEALNVRMEARYDAFPSLHLLITLTLLAFDWSQLRWRFWVMLGPSILMTIGTLALRLHYAVDLLASVVLFAALARFWRSDARIARAP